jgi:hypothetical protein
MRAAGIVKLKAPARDGIVRNPVPGSGGLDARNDGEKLF